MTRRRLLVGALQGVIVLGVVGAFGTAGFLEYSAQPGFCNTCHIMKPYYESWLRSSHNRVPCIKCHYPPGIKAEAMGKVQAANQVVKYLTRTYQEKPWAEIEDAACTREGCHLEQELGVVSFQGVRFDHQEHLGELRRGKQLRCTSCHSQIVQGEHVTVTRSTCFLCHFKDQPPGQPVGGCLSCHPSPPDVEYRGVPIDHGQIVAEMVSCVKCHQDVVVGDGAAQEERCWTCHNVPERVEQFGNTALIHRTHIAEHNVECQQCHTAIQHKVAALGERVELDCGNCHSGAHEAQRELFTGLGGHGVPETPSRMYLARVSCESCHALPGELPGHEGVARAGEATCLSCHGVRFANVLPEWQKGMEGRLERVEAVLDAARRELGPSPPPGPDSLLRAARGNVELVRVGRGVHNLELADTLLRSAVAMARQAVEGVGGAALPEARLGPPVAENACLQCHLGVEERDPLEWEGRLFRHGPHVLGRDFPCALCHTPMSEHGGLVLEGTTACDGCHHAPEVGVGCEGCHGPGPRQTFSTGTGRFPHEVHAGAGLPCRECHAPPGLDASGTDCTRCHLLHHTPTSECTACHGPEAAALHPPLVHEIGCRGCHGDPRLALLTTWTRELCLVCHRDRNDHFPARECRECHAVPEMPRGE